MSNEEAKAALRSLGGDAAFQPIEHFLDDLGTSEYVPRLTVGILIVRYDEAAPPLRALLAKAADRKPLSDIEEMTFLRGLHIMGGARDAQACAPLLRFLSLPEKEVDYFIGGTITETLPRIACGVFDDDVEALLAFLWDRSVDEYVRASMLSAAAFLTWDGRIPRDRMHAFLEAFYEERRANDAEYVWIAWLETIAQLGMRDLAPLVLKAWDEGRIDEGVTTRAYFKSDLQWAERAPGDPERFRSDRVGYIEDVLDTMSWMDRVRRMNEKDALELDRGNSWLREPWDLPQSPAVNPLRDVGRNDPCPCGSGKKAKRCCLA